MYSLLGIAPLNLSIYFRSISNSTDHPFNYVSRCVPIYAQISLINKFDLKGGTPPLNNNRTSESPSDSTQWPSQD